MRALRELTNPQSCMRRALPNELVFVLLGRDAASPGAIREWVHERIHRKMNLSTDTQIVDAMSTADAMEVEFLGVRKALAERDEETEITRPPCELKTIGSIDRLLSEMKYILDHPESYDTATYQTMKHHIEDMELFCAYGRVRLTVIKALPPTGKQRERGV